MYFLMLATVWLLQKFKNNDNINTFKELQERCLIAAAASEPEADERGSSLICRWLHYRGLQSLFFTKRKELWLCPIGRFRMRSGMLKGIVVMRKWMI